MDTLFSLDKSKVDALFESIRSGSHVEPSSFARITGMSEANVIRAWKDGRLPTERGSIPIREGIVALVSLGAFRRGRSPIPGYLIQADSLARGLLGLPEREGPCSDVPKNDGDEELREWKLRYIKAQTAARAATAAAKQRDNDIQRGALVQRSDVELDAAECATNIARALRRLPERAAGMCVGCNADEIADILRREISFIIEAIQVSAFTGDWDASP